MSPNRIAGPPVGEPARQQKHGGKYTLSELPWTRYRLRVCRSLHHCEVCDKDISLGQAYYDGGYSRRAHHTCVDKGDAHEPV